MSTETLLDLYSHKKDLYSSLAERTGSLLKILLNNAKIGYHVVEHRAKSYESLQDKISRPNKNYSSLDQVPDLAGVRIILYYQDDCQKVCEMISSEFNVIEKEDGHQPSSLDADRFGYLSFHIVVSSSKERANLVEWKDVSDLKCEIQIRTVIQHAWAAVSHQVQYKLESQIPSALQRKLNRISGLFELADEQFMSARDDREDLNSNKNTYNKNISVFPSSVKKFIISWNSHFSTKKLSENAGFRWDQSRDGDDILENFLFLCRKFNLNSIKELEENLGKFDLKFMKALIKESEKSGSDVWEIGDKFCILLHLILRNSSEIKISDLTDFGWDDDIADRVIDTARKQKTA